MADYQGGGEYDSESDSELESWECKAGRKWKGVELQEEQEAEQTSDLERLRLHKRRRKDSQAPRIYARENFNGHDLVKNVREEESSVDVGNISNSNAFDKAKKKRARQAAKRAKEREKKARKKRAEEIRRRAQQKEKWKQIGGKSKKSRIQRQIAANGGESRWASAYEDRRSEYSKGAK